MFEEEAEKTHPCRGVRGNILGEKLGVHFPHQLGKSAFLLLHYLPETTRLSTATTQVMMSWWPRNGLKRNFAFSHKDRSDDSLASEEETISAISHAASRAPQLVALDTTDEAAKARSKDANQ